MILATAAAAAELRIQTEPHFSSNCYDSQDSATISLSDLSVPISGFRLALGIEGASILSLKVEPGSFLQDCQWEYLTWRLTRPESIAQLPHRGSHVTAVLEITGLATVSVSHVPACNTAPGSLDLVNLTFLLATSDQENRCAFLPLRFYWRDCGDNVLYSASSDTVYVADQVLDLSLTPGALTAPFPGFGAPADQCDSSTGKPHVPMFTAVNGGFDLACIDSGSCAGDLNLDGTSFGVDDLIMYVNYFNVGVSAFGVHIAASVAQSDINGDGRTLTPDDLILMARIVFGDFTPPISLR